MSVFLSNHGFSSLQYEFVGGCLIWDRFWTSISVFSLLTTIMTLCHSKKKRGRESNAVVCVCVCVCGSLGYYCLFGHDMRGKKKVSFFIERDEERGGRIGSTTLEVIQEKTYCVQRLSSAVASTVMIRVLMGLSAPVFRDMNSSFMCDVRLGWMEARLVDSGG